MVLAGEQPGDVRIAKGDRSSGPVERLLDEAGTDSGSAYVTNVVTLATVHPSSILRAPDEDAATESMPSPFATCSSRPKLSRR